ncbi:HNH endonuclease [Streptomyces sp. SID3343]|uniref:HNH endonuclease n=1 Tax=Streptomyces sp. SID3343 TaxID=2690260 RepID=UPI001370C126|nr:HNH endonuclease [Streptomyces sp. SID3343]MYW05216.1 hypothetical protein [Streptomyces sp. SID3343]
MGLLLEVGKCYRYARPKDAGPAVKGGLPNFWHVTNTPGEKRALLESGINGIAVVKAIDGPRRPAVLIRSSPWKAGTVETPWHDRFGDDGATLRYFGDHKPGEKQSVGATKGNATLLAAWGRQLALVVADRRRAEPLLIFSSVPYEGRQKGQVRFDGVGLIENVERVEQGGGPDAGTFPNYAYDMSLISLEDNRMDWNWIVARRNPTVSLDQALKAAPPAWQEWVEQGRSALARVRRRGLGIPQSSAQKDLLPDSGGPDADANATAHLDDAVSNRERLIGETGVLVDDVQAHLGAIAAVSGTEVVGDEHDMYEVLSLLDHTTAGVAPPAVQPVTRREILLWQLIRDVGLARKVKALHNNECQVCGLRLEISSGPSSQAAHIRGLGRPDHGPDELSNLLCLCPNHHVLFDGLAIYVDAHGMVRQTKNGQAVEKLRRNPGHDIDEGHLEHHRRRCLQAV